MWKDKPIKVNSAYSYVGLIPRNSALLGASFNSFSI